MGTRGVLIYGGTVGWASDTGGEYRMQVSFFGRTLVHAYVGITIKKFDKLV